MDTAVHLGSCDSPCQAFDRLTHQTGDHRLQEGEGVFILKCVIVPFLLQPRHVNKAKQPPKLSFTAQERYPKLDLRKKNFFSESWGGKIERYNLGQSGCGSCCWLVWFGFLFFNIGCNILCRSGWPQTYKDNPACPSQVLGLKAFATSPRLEDVIFMATSSQKKYSVKHWFRLHTTNACDFKVISMKRDCNGPLGQLQ